MMTRDNHNREFHWVITLSLLLLATLGAQPAAAQSQIWPYLTYQGYLTDKGQPLTHDAVQLTFRIYNDELGTIPGNVVWQEAHTAQSQLISVTDGHFSVVLGLTTPLTTLFQTQLGKSLWLEVEIVQIGTESLNKRLTPRFQVTAVPYAFVCQEALTVRNLGKQLQSMALAFDNVSITPDGLFNCSGCIDGDDIDLTAVAGDGLTKSGKTLVVDWTKVPKKSEVYAKGETDTKLALKSDTTHGHQLECQTVTNPNPLEKNGSGASRESIKCPTGYVGVSNTMDYLAFTDLNLNGGTTFGQYTSRNADGSWKCSLLALGLEVGANLVEMNCHLRCCRIAP